MRRSLPDMLTTTLLLVVYIFLVAAAVRSWHTTGNPRLIIVAIQEALILGLLVTRRQAFTLSHSPRDWLVAFLGTASPVLFRDGWAILPTLGLIIQLTGLLLSIVALSALGRSFGIVAANRGVKTGGLYRWVRHPLYGAYLISQSGFLLGNLSVSNLVLFGVWVGCQHLRAVTEERTLLLDPAYATYHAAVRFRYLPGLI